MELVEPSLIYGESFKEAIQEFGEGHIPALIDEQAGRHNVPEYIEKTRQWSEGKNLPEGFVPSSTYWLIDNKRFVGHINIRHQLNEKLRLIGGNIGYAVRPSLQGKGYGTILLQLALKKAGDLGLNTILITCDKDNIGSRRVIEKNGGVFQQEIMIDGKPVLHFTIDL
jgi:predicted acetyltransferase